MMNGFIEIKLFVYKNYQLCETALLGLTQLVIAIILKSFIILIFYGNYTINRINSPIDTTPPPNTNRTHSL